MNFGPRPWLQAHWDYRAALNFICGGLGGGLLIATALLEASRGQPALPQVLVGLLLIGAGLTAVWLEIGRRLRALHTFFNPFTSWMTREAFVALFVFGFGLAALLLGGSLWTAASGIAAWIFVYCQGRILRGAKGIPAWREPAVVPLMLATSVAEGAGLLALAGASAALVLVDGYLALAVVLRALAWLLYHGRTSGKLASPAAAAIAGAGWWVLLLGTALPLALLAAATVFPSAARAWSAGAGVAAVAAGIWFKFVLITRASFNQGFALPHLPVRGQR